MSPIREPHLEPEQSEVSYNIIGATFNPEKLKRLKGTIQVTTVVIFSPKKDQVLLINRHKGVQAGRKAFVSGKGFFSEQGATPEWVASRELSRETGIDDQNLPALSLFCIYDCQDSQGNTQRVGLYVGEMDTRTTMYPKKENYKVAGFYPLHSSETTQLAFEHSQDKTDILPTVLSIMKARESI